MLGSPEAPRVFTAPALPVAVLGALQLGMLGLAERPIARLVRRRSVSRACAFALRAPMSLYLGFLTAMLLVVTVVATPSAIGNWFSWLARPSSLLALCLPAVPAVLVFWWFERHLRPVAEVHADQRDSAGRLDELLARAATVLGIGYATIGLFGLALASFGEVSGHQTLLGLSLQPIQSLVRMLLGICMLHTVRTGTSNTTSTWLLTAVSCVPPVFAATAGGTVEVAALVLHGLTALFAVAAALTTACIRLRDAHATLLA